MGTSFEEPRSILLRRKMGDDRALNLHLAKLAEQAERFEDMVSYMKKIIDMNFSADDLNQEERNLISVGYKNMISQRRQAIRSLDTAECANTNPQLKKQYYSTLAQEVDVVIGMVMDDVVTKFTSGAQAAKDPENMVFFHKMEGDYFRYGAEICKVPKEGEETDEESASELKRRTEYTEKARNAYQSAHDAGEQLAHTNPIKLGLALNQSVF